MPFIFSISGSTILSESSRLPDLFNQGCNAIEMGFFSDEQDYRYVLGECQTRQMPLAVHSPLYREGNHVGLMQDGQSGWDELEQDLARAQRDGLTYVLIHLQCLQPSMEDKDLAAIRSAVGRAAALSRRYNVPVVIEPKLGPNRDHSLLLLLHGLPLQELAGWGMSWCLDVGDIYMASQQSGVPYLEMVSHLAPLARVVHLHDVVMQGEHYYWTPVTGQDGVPIAETLTLLRSGEREIFVVVEHTPHLVESEDQVRLGISWLRGLLS